MLVSAGISIGIGEDIQAKNHPWEWLLIFFGPTQYLGTLLLGFHM